MASTSSELDPAAELHVVQESSSAEVGSQEAAAVEVEVEKEATEAEGEGENEEGECGFCLFMKGGGCKDAFVAWEECVEAAEEGSDMVERCFQATANLKKCMDEHADYYAPVLQAEQAVSDQAEAAIAAAAADADKSSGEGSAPSTPIDEKKKDAVAESTATAVSSTVAEETKKEEAVVEKVESSSLSN